jgi:uncharacterized membrane protein YeiB
VAQTERYTELDVIRGLALLSVLLVNPLNDFRISLTEHLSIRPGGMALAVTDLWPAATDATGGRSLTCRAFFV